MDSDQERLKILEMIEAGQITVEEGIRLLNALSEASDISTLPAEATAPEEPVVPAEPRVPAEPADDEQPAGVAGEADPFEVENPAFAQQTAPGPSLEETSSAEQAAPAEQAWDSAEAGSSQARSAPFEGAPEVIPPKERFDPSRLKWRNFWWIPMWVGVSIFLVGALLMYWAWSASGFGFWFACTWFPFLLGVAVMALAWSSRTARWLHLRVHQKPGSKPERIAISLPIPLRLTAWALRTFGKRIPNMENTGLDEVILALDATSPEAPFYLEVEEGANGERVEIYIG